MSKEYSGPRLPNTFWTGLVAAGVLAWLAVIIEASGVWGWLGYGALVIVVMVMLWMVQPEDDNVELVDRYLVGRNAHGWKHALAFDLTDDEAKQFHSLVQQIKADGEPVLKIRVMELDEAPHWFTGAWQPWGTGRPAKPIRNEQDRS